MKLKNKIKDLANRHGLVETDGVKRFAYHFSSNDESIAFMERMRSEDPGYDVCCVGDFYDLDDERDYRDYPYLVFYGVGGVNLTCVPSGPLVQFNIMSEVFGDFFIKRRIPKLGLL